MDIRLEDAQPENPFLFELYALTRADEVAAWGWGAEELEAFLAMQFRFQQQSYRMQYPEHRVQIVIADGRRVGKWHTAVHGNEKILVDIALLPDFRSMGIGTTLIRQLQEEARSAGLPLRLSVRTDNPARRLYERLGFGTVSTDELHARMRWTSLIDR
ncbi:GNAT family N-acetyltransferase [Paenibacillus arenilitoris]|uniref:GNAT family N-acetyltransferase n=1 Tax=Paenibacillus arenilitoris TaxID=2772299 RepID=A0A927CGL1_9BACL|nr:GNAT family N-acetyltransferase [Paenibacillus arenilitoris]MBD2867719.1 GNAT family N-acetyltransferase [Paenibacillus arenilitoris]